MKPAGYVTLEATLTKHYFPMSLKSATNSQSLGNRDYTELCQISLRVKLTLNEERATKYYVGNLPINWPK